MELALIVIGLLAAAAGLTVVAAACLRWASDHRPSLLGPLGRACRLRQQQWLGRGPLFACARVRLEPGWMAGFWLALGLLLMAVTAAAAGELVEHLTAGHGMALVDRPVAGFVAAHRTAALTTIMRLVSSGGGPVVLGIVTAAAGLLLGAARRSWVPVLIAGLTLAGSVGLTFVLKAALSRPRPPLHDALAPADGYAFPSAHAATAAATFGVLAYLVVLRVRRRKMQVTMWACAAALTTLVGTSRVYLGVHWTTDVLGGWAFGLLWLTIVVSACRRLLVRRRT